MISSTHPSTAAILNVDACDTYVIQEFIELSINDFVEKYRKNESKFYRLKQQFRLVLAVKTFYDIKENISKKKRNFNLDNPVSKID